MDTSEFPQLNFPQLEIAKLKDSILRYLSNNSIQPIPSVTLFDILKPEDVLLDDFNEYIKEMSNDDVIIADEMSGNRSLLRITEKGKIYLRGGGFSEDAKDDLNRGFQELLEKEKRGKKLDLEIENLRASIIHYRHTRRISIWAIIISIISLISSIAIWLITQFILVPLFSK